MNPKAAVIAVGTELLKGSVLNTNSFFISRALHQIGIRVATHIACHDEIQEIENSLGQALSQADIVFLSGGLGPTPDDLTRDAVAHFFRVRLKISKSQLTLIKNYYKKRRHRFLKIVEKEAMYPENAKPLVNRQGIALGFCVPCGQKLLIVLPGVPYELERMITDQVVPLIKKYYPGLKPKPALTAKIIGLSEPEVMEKLGKDFFDDPFEFGIYPAPGEVAIRINAESSVVIHKLFKKVKTRLGKHVYSFEEATFAETVSALLTRRKQTLAIAESCTGGLLASEFAKIPGASRFFKGAVVAYDNQVKTALGVSKSLIKKQGAVSRPVACELAKKIRASMKTSFGIGITGIAGPAGASRSKPVGTVFVALDSRQGCQVREFHFWGARRQVQTKAVIKALELLWATIHGRSKSV